jgi:hypothetical protein
MGLFDHSLKRLELKTQPTSRGIQEDEPILDDGYSDGEDPGPQFVRNENLVLNPSEPSDVSADEGLEIISKTNKRKKTKED